MTERERRKQCWVPMPAEERIEYQLMFEPTTDDGLNGTCWGFIWNDDAPKYCRHDAKSYAVRDGELLVNFGNEFVLNLGAQAWKNAEVKLELYYATGEEIKFCHTMKGVM